MIAPPPTLAPPAPFPLVIAQSRESEFVAPGVARTTYRLMTPNGPLVVHVVTVDTTEPTVRLRAITATDRLVSSGETLSSMALRTGAVAGVNADYFDIGSTYQPLNLVVGDGALVRTPSKRVTMQILHDRTIRFGSAAFSGSVAYPAGRVPLTHVNEYPPEGGASFVTPRFGTLRPAADVTLALLERAGAAASDGATAALAVGAPKYASRVLANSARDPQPNGVFRVVATQTALAPTDLRGPALAFGPAAAKLAAPPSAGDLVQIASALDPALDQIDAAVGGGPLLVAAGAIADDPNAPAPEERDVRFPVSGAAVAGGTLLHLVAVDGRQPSLSVGLTRPEFAALMLGLGASDAMAFDSGGSAEVVARTLGDASASVQNAPSDGEERRIADGLFVYSDARYGEHPQLVVHPNDFATFGGARLALTGAVVDDGGHRLRAATLDPLVALASNGPHVASVREPNGTLRANVAYRTVARATSLALDPERPNPNPRTTVEMHVRAFDASGAPIRLGETDVRWLRGITPLDARGPVVEIPAGTTDFDVTALVGRESPARVSTRVLVGSRRIDLPIFSAAAQGSWRFTSAPPGAPGTIAFEPSSDGALTVTYDFRNGERAAYASTNLALPGEPRTFGIDVLGDASGVGVRASFVNRFGERRALTLARDVDWNGWRSVTLDLPPDLNPPLALTALYVVPSLGNGRVIRAAGSVRFRTPFVTIAGSR